MNDQIREIRRSLRLEALAAYGGKCACCGEATPEFLAIDHVRNDGRAHRRALKKTTIYRWLKDNGFPQDGRFQLLCHNCNGAKGYYGGCPHQGPVPYRATRTPRLSASEWVIQTADRIAAARRERMTKVRAMRSGRRPQAGQQDLFGAAS